jgi:SOS-response transcriptional repressor LexA
MIYYFRMPDPDTKTTLQNWIDAGLSKPGKTNTELARLLGIPQSRVSEMRHGGRTPKISEIQTIALYIEEPIPDAYNPSVGLAAKLQAQRQLAEQLAEQRVAAARLRAGNRATATGVVNKTAAEETQHARVRVPLISWVSAGKMSFPDITDEIIGHIQESDLDPPDGDWIALRVVGDSMDRISPPDSIIFVDRSDKVLAPNACYVISNGDGEASYKRFRPNPMRFEPVSTNPAHEPIYPMREPLIVGRVKKSTIKM